MSLLADFGGDSARVDINAPEFERQFSLRLAFAKKVGNALINWF